MIGDEVVREGGENKVQKVRFAEEEEDCMQKGNFSGFPTLLPLHEFRKTGIKCLQNLSPTYQGRPDGFIIIIIIIIIIIKINYTFYHRLIQPSERARPTPKTHCPRHLKLAKRATLTRLARGLCNRCALALRTWCWNRARTFMGVLDIFCEDSKEVLILHETFGGGVHPLWVLREFFNQMSREEEPPREKSENSREVVSKEITTIMAADGTRKEELEQMEHANEGIVSKGEEPTKEDQKEEFKKKDDKALLIIHQCVDDAHFEKIQNANTTKEAWNILCRCHAGGEKIKKVRLQTLRKQYEMLQMQDDEKISEYFNKIMTLTNQMKSCGEKKLDDVSIMEKIMRSLPKNFDYITVAVEESKDLEKLKIEELQSSLEAHEMRLRDRETIRLDDQALRMQHAMAMERRNSRLGGINLRHRVNGRMMQMMNGKAYLMGHFSYECWFNKGRSLKKDHSKEAYLAKEESDTEPVMLMATTLSANREPLNHEKPSWYLDSGCSNHMTCNKEKSKVRVADNNTLQVEGIGNVVIKRKNGTFVIIKNVLLVPEMKCNLLSIGQLVENGFTVIMGNKGQVEIFDKDKKLVLRTNICKNRTFQVSLDMVVKDHENWRWHLKYGHMNFHDLQRLRNKGMVFGLPDIVISEDSYVCGPMKTPTLSGNRYFITFVDEFSCMTWVFLIKFKSDVLEVFKRYKKQVENESERRIKLLRTDDGREYTTHEFKEYCCAQGIIHEVIAPYTPQHNGLAERRNRTIMNMAWSLLKEKGVIRELWGEAVATSVYLLNKCPTKVLPDDVPHAKWTGMKPSIKHLRIFGSLVFSHIADQKRSKLDDKEEAMVFVGYHSTGAYKLYNPIKKRMIISQDVVFLEEESWNWEINQTSMKTSRSVMQLPLQVEEDCIETETKETSRSVMQLPLQVKEIETRINKNQNPEEISTRPRRQTVIPSRFTDFEVFSDAGVDEKGSIVHLALLAGSEPVNVKEALSQPHWKEAMEEELRSIERNETWKMVDLPPDKQCIGVKWVFKTKLNLDGTVSKHKARLETICVVIAITCAKKWTFFALDVKSAFLHGHLEEEVYVNQPPDFSSEENKHKVYKLNKALYGLRQAPRAWNKRINYFLISQGFERSVAEHNLYVKKDNRGNMLILYLYVDDLMVTGSCLEEIIEFKAILKAEFDMTDLGRLSYFLGLEFTYTAAGVFMHQKKFIKDLLDKFKMTQCNEAGNPLDVNAKLRLDEEEESVDETGFKQIIGSLRFLCNSIPDLAYGVGLLSRFMSKPKKSHLIAAKRILRYVKGTSDYGIFFSYGIKAEALKLVGYTDADFRGDQVERKSTSGNIFFINDTPVSWSSKKQTIVALLSCEAEYVAGCSAVCQGIWLCELLKHLRIQTEESFELKMDNTFAMSLARNPISHGRSKHIDVKFHFLREMVNQGKVVLKHCKTEFQLAYLFTKALNQARFDFLDQKLGYML
ncbi:hypothetical protein V8G54_034170 [Vigna mungo]|uniref:Integrase catalytic domain-containing protein n=1 Tax=Vigna mungo TaxID=3915 RepID=A0AAQ3RJH3_VIGMU